MSAPRRYLVAAAVLIGSLATCRPDRTVGPNDAVLGPSTSAYPKVEGTLTPDYDTYVSNLGDTPRGELDSMIVDGPERGRILLYFDPAAILGAAGNRALVGASLDLTVKATDGTWPAGGGNIQLHRLLQAWTEAGATWSCAQDSDPGNGAPDCSGPTAWDMANPSSPPWDLTTSASATVMNTTSGTLSFDVTADVLAFLAGQKVNNGWILKSAVEGSSAPGRISFGTREATLKPRLVLTLGEVVQSQPILAAIVGEGVTGSPSSGVVEYDPGTNVSYSFQLASGYVDLVVLLDGQPIPPDGVVRVASAQLLHASAMKTLQPLPGTEGLVSSARALLTDADPVSAFQAHVNSSIAYAESVDSATAQLGLELVDAVAWDPVADSVALLQLDDALANKVFALGGGLEEQLPPAPSDSAEPTTYLHVNGMGVENEERSPFLALRRLIRNLPNPSWPEWLLSAELCSGRGSQTVD